VRVEANVATGQLHAVAALSSSECFSRCKKSRANAETALVASYVHALELAAPSARVLEVLKHEDLTHAYHFPIHLGHEYVTATTTRLFDGRPVRVDVRLVLYFRCE